MINYNIISDAIKHYEYLNIPQEDLKWECPEEFMNLTLPTGSILTTCSSVGPLVGSAEQSFLYKAYTENRKIFAQATTPCFRDEDEDELHKKYFLKTELFYFRPDNNQEKLNIALLNFMDYAERFFKKYLSCYTIRTGDQSFDINCSITDIELGSYGIKHHPKIGSWVYGTGVAEPRLSYVIEKVKDLNGKY